MAKEIEKQVTVRLDKRESKMLDEIQAEGEGVLRDRDYAWIFRYALERLYMVHKQKPKDKT